MEEYSHPILQLILLDDQSALKRRKPKNTQIDICSEREGYIFRCSKGIVVLDAAMGKAAFSIELLKDAKKLLRNSTISHAEQIQFAIENYFIRSATIYDRALIFVGHLLDLGVTDDRIDHVDIVTNRHVKRYTLDVELKKLGSICRKLSDERNAIIHHRSYSDETFDRFAMLVAANDLSVRAGKRRPFPQALVKNLTGAILRDHTSDYEDHLAQIKTKLDNLLDTAAAVYKIRRETYSDEIQEQPIVDDSTGEADQPV